MDIAQLAGLDYRDVTLDGRLYRVGELTLGEWAPVQAWLKANSPRPMAALHSAEMVGLSKEDRAAVIKLALDESRAWPPQIASKSWIMALDAPGGHAMLLLALLGKHQPNLTLDVCADLAERLTIFEVLPLILFGLGLDEDPKSPAPVPTGAGKPSRPERRRRNATTSGPSHTR